MLRPAAQTDIPFAAALQSRPEFRTMIALDSAQGLSRDLLDPETSVMVWETETVQQGFVVLDQPIAHPGRVELRRVVVDNPGHGIGRPLLVAVCNHVFGALAAHRFYCDVAADNICARRAYERAGFRHEGTLRNHWNRPSGDWVDLAYYGMLRDDWHHAKT